MWCGRSEHSIIMEKKICRFCYNHIKENLNSRCPACRREYSDQTVEFTPLTPAEYVRPSVVRWNGRALVSFTHPLTHSPAHHTVPPNLPA